MNVKINKRPLLDALEKVSKAVNHSSGLEVMRGILFILSNAGLKIIGSDTVITIVTTIPADQMEITRLGSIVLPAKKIVDIIKSFPQVDIEINVKSGQAHIAAGRTNIKLPGTERDMYTYKPVKTDQTMILSGDDLKSLIKRSAYAASDKGEDQILKGVRIMTDGCRLSLASTNRHRAAKVYAEVENAQESIAVLSAKHLKEVSSLLGNKDAVQFAYAENQAVFIADDITVSCSLVDGKYPDLDRNLIVNEKTRFVAETATLIQAIKRIGVVVSGSGEKTNAVYMTVNEKDIHLFGKTEGGRVDETIDIEAFDGEPLRIAFDADYALEALLAVDYEDVVVKMSDTMLYLMDGKSDDIHLLLAVRTTKEAWE